MLKGYFDDSGTHDGARAVVWGGVVGDKENFAFLNAKWRELLACPSRGKPPLSQFHLSNCRSGSGEFRGYSQAERDSVRHDFRKLIVNSGVAPVAYGVDLYAWDRLITQPGRSPMDAESLVFGKCAEAMIQSAEHHDDQIEVMFDRGRKNQVVHMIKEAQSLHADSQKLASFGWAECKTTPGLQAADTVAYEFYRYAIRWVEDIASDPEAHLMHFRDQYETSEFYTYMMGEDQIKELLDNLAEG